MLKRFGRLRFAERLSSVKHLFQQGIKAQPGIDLWPGLETNRTKVRTAIGGPAGRRLG